MNEKKVVGTNLRLNLEKEAHRRAWDCLKDLRRKAGKSYTQIIIDAVIDYYDRQERMHANPYSETREDAFFQRIQEAITEGQHGVAALGVNGGLEGATTPFSPPESVTEAQREASINVALEFADSF